MKKPPSARADSARPASTASRARTPREDPGTVSALQRGLDLLCCFEPGNRPLSHAELTRASGLPKQSLGRLLHTLCQAGFLRLDPQAEKYSLGARVLTLSQAYVSSYDVRAIARPLMQALAQRAGATVYLGVVSELDMLIIEAARSQQGMLITRLDVGSRVPMSTSALGRAYLLSLDAERRQDLLQRLAATHGEHWPPILRNLKASWKQAHTRGYCVSLGEFYPDMHSAACAVRSASGDTVVLNCGGPSMHLSARIIEEKVGPALLETAHQLGLAIGQRPPAAASRGKPATS